MEGGASLGFVAAFPYFFLLYFHFPQIPITCKQVFAVIYICLLWGQNCFFMKVILKNCLKFFAGLVTCTTYCYAFHHIVLHCNIIHKYHFCTVNSLFCVFHQKCSEKAQQGRKRLTGSHKFGHSGKYVKCRRANACIYHEQDNTGKLKIYIV